MSWYKDISKNITWLKIKDYLEKQPSVNTLYRINNGYDYMLEGVFRHVRGMENFLEKLDDFFEIKDKKVYYIINDIKKDMFLGHDNDIETLQLV